MQIRSYQPAHHKIKAVIYGASGSGKTVFGSTAPSPIFASAEGGMLSIADKKLPYAEIATIKDLRELLHYLQTQKHPYKTVVIDSITEINEIIKAEIEHRTGHSLVRQEWAEVAKQIKEILRGFRNLPMHVLFIAQESDSRDEDKIVKIVPSLNGKAATEIAYFMDIVGYLLVDADGERKILTTPSGRYLTKDRSGAIGNDADVDFSNWCQKISKIKTGAEKIIQEYEAPPEEATIKKKSAASNTPPENNNYVLQLKQYLAANIPNLPTKKEAANQAAEKYILDNIKIVVRLAKITETQAKNILGKFLQNA